MVIDYKLRCLWHRFLEAFYVVGKQWMRFHISQTKVLGLVLDQPPWEQSHHLAVPTFAYLKEWKWKGRAPCLCCFWEVSSRIWANEPKHPLNRKQGEGKAGAFCLDSNYMTIFYCQNRSTVTQQPVANGWHRSSCHFENILDFTVRNPQAAPRNVSDSVASDVSVDLDIRKQALAHWLCTQNFPLGLCCCYFSPKG